MNRRKAAQVLAQRIPEDDDVMMEAGDDAGMDVDHGALAAHGGRATGLDALAATDAMPGAEDSVYAAAGNAQLAFRSEPRQSSSACEAACVTLAAAGIAACALRRKGKASSGEPVGHQREPGEEAMPPPAATAPSATIRPQGQVPVALGTASPTRSEQALTARVAMPVPPPPPRVLVPQPQLRTSRRVGGRWEPQYVARVVPGTVCEHRPEGVSMQGTNQFGIRLRCMACDTLLARASRRTD